MPTRSNPAFVSTNARAETAGRRRIDTAPAPWLPAATRISSSIPIWFCLRLFIGRGGLLFVSCRRWNQMPCLMASVLLYRDSLRSRIRLTERSNGIRLEGFVTLLCREREVSAPHELSGRCDCGPPRGHRDGAKRAVRVGGDEVALDVEGVVDGGMCGKKLLG